MKLIISLFIAFVSAAGALAQSAATASDRLIAKADSAYTADNQKSHFQEYFAGECGYQKHFSEYHSHLYHFV